MSSRGEGTGKGNQSAGQTIRAKAHLAPAAPLPRCPVAPLRPRLQTQRAELRNGIVY